MCMLCLCLWLFHTKLLYHHLFIGANFSADAASGRILSLLTERGYLGAVATEGVDASRSNSAI